MLSFVHCKDPMNDFIELPSSHLHKPSERTPSDKHLTPSPNSETLCLTFYVFVNAKGSKIYREDVCV